MKKAVAGCIFFIYFISCILLAISFATVTPLEAGLLKNSIDNKVSADKVFIAGRYFTDVVHTFVKYPTTLQYISFGGPESTAAALRAADATGQQVTIQLSFQYRLMVTKISDLFFEHALAYETQIISYSSEAIKNVIKSYTFPELIEQRERVGEVLHAALNVVLQEEVFAVVEHFQLLQVDPPSATASRILNKLVTQETVKTQRTMKETQVLETNITLKSQEAEQISRVYISNANRESQNIRSTAEAQAVSIKLNATAMAYKNLQQGLSLTNDELIQFLYLDHLRNLGPSASMAIGVDTALFKL